MAESFRASFVKIERALKHFQELEALAAEYIASDPVKYSMKAVGPSVGTFGGLEVTTSVTGMPEITGAIIGDIIHNLRTSLDLMACELCRVKGNSDKDVYFPFCDTARDLPSAIKRRNFYRAGQAAVDLLTEMKPYKGGNIGLRAIHDLDIQDKHKELIPGTVSVASAAFSLPVIEGKVVPKIIGDQSKPSELRLLFPNDSALAGRDLLPTLHELMQLTAGIVESFKALSTPPG